MSAILKAVCTVWIGGGRRYLTKRSAYRGAARYVVYGAWGNPYEINRAERETGAFVDPELWTEAIDLLARYYAEQDRAGAAYDVGHVARILDADTIDRLRSIAHGCDPEVQT
jgi:hypothetical protein